MPGSWLADKPVIPGSKAIAAIWGGRQPQPSTAGGALPGQRHLAAACCLARQLPLATLNLKDFKEVVEHHGLRLLEP